MLIITFTRFNMNLFLTHLLSLAPPTLGSHCTDSKDHSNQVSQTPLGIEESDFSASPWVFCHTSKSSLAGGFWWISISVDPVRKVSEALTCKSSILNILMKGLSLRAKYSKLGALNPPCIEYYVTCQDTSLSHYVHCAINNSTKELAREMAVGKQVLNLNKS